MGDSVAEQRRETTRKKEGGEDGKEMDGFFRFISRV
jgi:hypothetical protein